VRRNLSIFIWLIGSILVAGCEKNEGHSSAPSSKTIAPDINLYPIRIDGLVGYINRKGEIAIEPQFSTGRDFSENLAAASIGGDDILSVPGLKMEFHTHNFKGEKYGYINRSGKFVINPQYDYADDFNEDAAIVVNQKKWGFIDTAGKYITQPQYTYASPFSEGLAAVQIGGKLVNGVLTGGHWGYIDKSGSMKIPAKFDDVGGFHEGIAPAAIDGKWGYINKEGAFVISPQFDWTGGFIEGLARIQVQGKKTVGATREYKEGFIDKTGRIVIEPQFDSTYPFSEGLAAVAVGGTIGKKGYYEHSKWGFIDHTGRFAINPQFDEVGSFSEGRAEVKLSHESAIDTAKTVEDARKHGIDIEPLNSNLQPYAFIDKNGNIIGKQFEERPMSRLGDSKAYKNGLAKIEYWTDINPPKITPEGLPIVKKEVEAYVDLSGNMVFDARYYGKPPSESDSQKQDSPKQESYGTAFFVSIDGYLLTAAHVADQCIELNLPQYNLIAKLIASDLANDVALLKIDKKPTDFIKFRTDELKQGEQIIVYGFPLKEILASGGNVASGNVSALAGLGNNMSQIQMTAPVQPGESGSPLIDSHGRLVGLVTSKLNAVKVAKLTGDVPQNINFAVKSNILRTFLDSNKISWESPWLTFGSKTTEEIAEDARKYTVIVNCKR